MNWKKIRIIIIFIGCIFGLVSGLYGSRTQQPINWEAVILVSLFTPIIIVILMGFHALIPIIEITWKRTDWSSNPFSIKDPLQFFHMGAITFMATGIFGLIAPSLSSKDINPETILLIGASAGIWVGVRICEIIFKNKMGV